MGYSRLALLALGSNLGRRPCNIRAALEGLQACGLEPLITSSIVSTNPVIPEDSLGFSDVGGKYLNAVTLVNVNSKVGSSPLDILRAVLGVESDLGRVRSTDPLERYAPRVIDIDVLFDSAHKTFSWTSPALTLPHPRIVERSFVWWPLLDIMNKQADWLSFERPDLANTDDERNADRGQRHLLEYCSGKSQAMRTIAQFIHETMFDTGKSGAFHDDDDDGSMPFSRDYFESMRESRAERFHLFANARAQGFRAGVPLGDEGRLIEGPYGTAPCVPSSLNVMGILNVTDDSFSDGGRYNSVDTAVAHATELVLQGANIIDVGGQSTRPGARRVSVEDELARVIPVLRALRASETTKDIPISLDTFYGRVAEEGVKAGASIINDVSGGSLDPSMLSTVAALPAGVPYIIMHMRGDPTSMQSSENTTYHTEGSHSSEQGIIGKELGQRILDAIDRGIDAWRIIVDPGFGFAKTTETNIALLKNLERFRDYLPAEVNRAPLLVGLSRKRFIANHINGAMGEVREHGDLRENGTMIANAIAVQKGAQILRVHNVRNGVDTAALASGVRVKELLFN